MKNFKILILLTILLLSSSTIQAQGVFHILGGLRGLRGDRSLEEIESRIGDIKITDINSLKDFSSIKLEKYVWYKGLTVYNPVDFSSNITKIEKGLYTWDGTKWIKTYSVTPIGSLKGDLQALHAILHHPSNKINDTKGFHSWKIDLENIDNPENLNLTGVFFREINGEYRIQELNLEDFYFKNITITEGLEALASCRLFYNDRLQEVSLKLPSLVHFICEQNEWLVNVNLSCPNLASILSKKNSRKANLNISNCPKLSFLSVFKSRMTTLDVSKNTNLSYLLCYDNALTTLDVSKNTKLSYLQCNSNALNALDVSYNSALAELHCSYNKIDTLDMSKNTVLQKLGCSYNSLKELDVINNKNLEELWCGYNALKILDLSENINLINLECSQNFRLASLDVSNCVELKTLKCAENKLTSLDLSRHVKLEKLDIYLSELIMHPNSVKICNTVVEKISSNSSFSSSIKDSGVYEIIDCE